MGGSVPTPDGYRRVGLLGPGWALDAVHVAVGHRARRLGVKAGGVDHLVLSTRSIHTFGLDRAVRVTTIDGDGLVTGSEVVAPRRVRTWLHRMWVLETPVDAAAPTVGTTIGVVASSVPCPEP